MPRALISVSDKRGIVEFAHGLVELGWQIVSTGGTAAALRKADIPVTTGEGGTGFPADLAGGGGGPAPRGPGTGPSSPCTRRSTPASWRAPTWKATGVSSPATRSSPST